MVKSGKKSQASNISNTQKEVVPSSPKEEFNTNALKSPSVEMAERKENHRTAIFIDLKYLKEWGLNLEDWLKPYVSWIEIKDDYDIDVIRVFFSNLSVTKIKDKDGYVIGMTFKSQVRGQSISYDDDSLNTALGVTDPTYRVWEKYEKMPEKRYCEILGLEVEDKKTSAEMCDEHRILHMVYSRLLVNNSGNFTNLTEQDNPILGRLIAKLPLNPGMVIIQDLQRFLTKGTKKPTFPYLQVISCLLKMEN